MTFNPAALRKIQQWGIILTVSLSTCILWVNAWNSGIPKQPVLVLGATFVLTLFLGSMFLKKTIVVYLSIIEILVAFHIPLFFFSAALTFNTLYTSDALALGAACIVLYFAGTSLFPTKKEASFFFASIEVLTAVLCVVGFAQYFFGKDLPLDFFIGENNRVTSLLGNSTFFAAYLVLVFPLVASQALYQRTANKTALPKFLLMAGIIFLMFITQTRSSIIAFGVSLLVFALLSLKKTNATRVIGLLFIAAAGTVVWMFVLYPALGQRFMTMFAEDRSSTFARRMYFWDAGVNAFLGSPWVGHGIGSFEQTVLSYRSPEYWIVGSEDIVPHAHNELIEIATEYGTIGLVLCTATIGLLLYRGISIARKGKGWEGWTALGLSCSIIAIGVDSLANVALRQSPIAAIAWLFMGLLSSQLLKKEKVFSVSFEMPTSGILAAFPLVAWICWALLYGRHQLDLFHADVHVMQGIKDRNKTEVAIREYEQSVAKNPKHLFAQSMLTSGRMNAHEWKPALQSLGDLNRFSPLYPKSSLMKAYTYYGLQAYTEAAQAINAELKLRSHPEAYDVQAQIYRQLRDDGQERTALVNLLRKDIEGGISYKYRTTCLRLFELSKSENEKKELFALFDSLQNHITGDPEFFKQLDVLLHGQ